MTKEEFEKHKQEILKMSHLEMAKFWRFSASHHPYWQTSLYKVFLKRFREFGGMTTEISKQIGWD